VVWGARAREEDKSIEEKENGEAEAKELADRNKGAEKRRGRSKKNMHLNRDLSQVMAG
jgi:hypothetical protein